MLRVWFKFKINTLVTCCKSKSICAINNFATYFSCYYNRKMLYLWMLCSLLLAVLHPDVGVIPIQIYLNLHNISLMKKKYSIYSSIGISWISNSLKRMWFLWIFSLEINSIDLAFSWAEQFHYWNHGLQGFFFSILWSMLFLTTFRLISI